jgi:hypothetical protein
MNLKEQLKKLDAPREEFICSCGRHNKNGKGLVCIRHNKQTPDANIRDIVKVYRLDAYDEENRRWYHVGMDMCHGDFLCSNCRKHPENRDICDYRHEEVFDKQIAIDKHNSLAKEGIRSIISEREVKADGTTTDGIPSKTKVLGILPNEL